MANIERQMPVHVEATYKDAVDNVIFLKRGDFRNLSPVF
jgi:hypothetical protein